MTTNEIIDIFSPPIENQNDFNIDTNRILEEGYNVVESGAVVSWS